MNEIILFSLILVAGIVIFLLMMSKKKKKTALPTQNYDDKPDRLVDQLDNL